MLTFINNSCFGQLVYYLSNRNYCKLKEEQNDYVVPEKYVLSVLSSISSTSSYDEKSTNNNIIVTWDGEDDPEIHTVIGLFTKNPFSYSKFRF